ncbi:MAG: type IV pilin N-terminal domain-containing protein [Methanocalculaceae archaeon]|jgi:hypothetical protein|nr:type IV pilin N-terminal domain-containing protein [Methanocalculaceae archaeon]
MDYYLRLHGICGTKNRLRKLKAVSKNRAMSAGDDGVTPAIAVVMLIGLVAVAGAVIGLAMFAAVEDTSGTMPDVRFQVSADGKSLYHAGGDVLPLKSLVFYNTVTKENVPVHLVKGGSTKAATPTEWDVWETGDKILFGEEMFNALSIVGLDSRGHPVLLWMGSNAAVLPVGDMVPDEWGDISGGGEEKPDFPYVIEPITSWQEFKKEVNARNEPGMNWGTMIVFWDVDTSLWIAMDDQYVTKSQISDDPTLEEYSQKYYTGKITYIDTSSRILTIKNDTTVVGSDRTWNTENGVSVAQRGSLCVDNGNLYIATSTPGSWDKPPTFPWSRIGHEIS